MRSPQFPVRVARPYLLLLVFFASVLRAELVINEFMAINDSGLRDEDGDESDWIEIANTGVLAVDLDGWFLTDDAAKQTKWSFPSVILGAGDALLVFASGKDRRDGTGELHLNFKLSGVGEYLALVEPDGQTIAHAFAPGFPPQYPDVSYGLATVVGQAVSLVGTGADCRFLIPGTDADDVQNPTASPPWNAPNFDDGDWTATPLGIGYARPVEDAYDEFIGSGGDVEAEMDGLRSGAYVRIPFELEDAATVVSLTLLMRYDDGFVAYLNGGTTTVAGANAPADGGLAYDSTATANHPDGEATGLQAFPIDLSGVNLVSGTNVLAVHGMNRTASNSDFLIDCELEAILGEGGGDPELVYMDNPTPGEANAGGVVTLGPIFRAVTESAPAVVGESELLVTAMVQEVGVALDAVRVLHRRMYGAESAVVMRDDGVSPDLLAGDGVYSGIVPLAGLLAGEMVRWRFEASDTDGNFSRAPSYHDPLNSAEYFGTMAVDAGITSALPVLHWFVENEGAANTRTGTRASAWFRGEFYDNFFVRIRGGSTAGFAKKSYKFDFNSGGHFRFDPAFGRAEEINLNQTWSDKAYIRQALSFEVYDRCGSPGSEVFLVRLHRNGAFHSINAFVEQPDRRLLKREGLGQEGALYKMYNGMTSGTSGVEKKNRKHEDHSDLIAFVAGVNNNSGISWERFLFDHVDVPRQLNYLVATVLTQNNDNMRKNYYIYRDSDGSGEWFQVPWDADLTWGSHYMTGDSSAHDGIWATADYVLGGRNQNAPISPSHPFVGTQELPGNRSWNKLIDKLHENPRFVEMFRRRLRTVMDEVLAPPILEDRIAEMQAMLAPDAEEDRLKWGQFGQSQTLAEAIGILTDDYLAPRRTHLFSVHLAGNAGTYPTYANAAVVSALLPTAQASPQIDFGSVEVNPSSGNQDEEFVVLHNPNPVAVDLTGWSLDGGVTHSFLPGTVIEAGGNLYLSPDAAAFRARPSDPTGGQGHFVQGSYKGHLSSRGELLTLRDRSGAMVATLTTTAQASPAQLGLRITELHYAPPGGTDDEFIELMNVGAEDLDLEGVHFTQGISVRFGLGVSLAPGEIGILVRVPERFPSANVLGVYTGGLSNDGEQITLRDASGENVLSFNYLGDWFPPARTGGYSIGIIDPSAGWETWDDPTSWALSCELGGSPGLPNPPEHSQVFDAWQREMFSSAELMDPAVSGPEADASGDGVSNLMNYALGLEPTVNSLAGLPIVSLVGAYPEFSYRRVKKAVDLSYVVECSPNLIDWAIVTTEVGAPVDQGNGIEVVTMQGASVADGESQFFRLRVTK